MATLSQSSGTFIRRLGRWSGEWKELLKLRSLTSHSERLGKLYDTVGTRNLFGEDSLFINLGYWKNNPATLDEASKALARLVAQHAAFTKADIVVDVGTGYGDQDVLWADEFSPKEIIGVNVAEDQIAISTQRVHEAGLDNRVRYLHASAIDLPLQDASVSKVVALESPFHFPSRTKFFAEAYRVLQEGGRLVTADITLRRPHNVTLRLLETYWRKVRRPVLMAEDELNVETYRTALNDAGFTKVEVYSIRNHVYAPLSRFLGKRLNGKDTRMINPVWRLIFSKWGVRFWSPWADYIIAEAHK